MKTSSHLNIGPTAAGTHGGHYKEINYRNVETVARMPRELGLLGAMSLIIGTIIGSGIFVSPTGVLKATGSVGLSLIVWFGAGLISIMGALCYCELGTMIPKSGGEYTYIRESWGNCLGFLFIWTSQVLVRPSSLAVMSLTFGTYFAALFDLCGQTETFARLAAAVCLGIGMMVNSYSSRLAKRVLIVALFCKIGALLIIIGGGVYNLALGKLSVFDSGFESSTTDVSAIPLAFYDALWAYDGWVNLNAVTEELKRPSRNLPIAVIGSLCLVIVVYLGTNIAYLTAMSPTELIQADTVAVLFGERVLGQASILMPIAVIISTFGSCTASTFAGGRPLFAAARDGNLPQILSFIHVDKLTPLPAMLFLIILSVTLIFLGDIFSLINFLTFSVLLFNGMTFAAVILFRFTRPTAPRPYKVPIIIPVVMLPISSYLVIAPIVRNPAIEFLYSSIIMLAGLVFYIPIYFKWSHPATDTLSRYIQLLMKVVPPSKNID